MNTTQHALAAIISLTQYEAAVYDANLDAARTALLDTMRHIIAIAKQTPAAPAHRPHDLGRPDRACRYHRIIHSLTAMLPLDGRTPDIHNHVALAWWECVELCQYHGWMPTTTLQGAVPARATVTADRPLLASL